LNFENMTPGNLEPSKPGNLDPIKVGMAELAIASTPAKITTIGLGSCVGVVFYDKSKSLGAMAHIMLPSSTLSKKGEPENKAKYADSAVSDLFSQMLSKGSRRTSIVAKIFGGANMFSLIVRSNKLMNMGDRNVAAVREELDKIGIKIVAEEVGGNVGRTITLDTTDGKVYLRTIKGERREY